MTTERAAPIFVVQEHLADRAGLHYDFRLESGGVLWSWAVPKGPSMDPSQKRMAIRVDDHAVEYAGFQGAIPSGYGAGTVKTWDSGTWEPDGDPAEGLARGELRFELRGSRLRGRFALIKVGAADRQAWILVKARDEHALPGGSVELTNPDREVWPGVTKRGLAEYWASVAEAALPGIARRPLAVVRCPDGVSGERFFQRSGSLHPLIREGRVAGGAPYLAVDGADGLAAMAQISAVEIHAWGATEERPLRPDQLVFDLDPGPGVSMASLAWAAGEVRERLARLGLASFCRTTGAKGLHVVSPLVPGAPWDAALRFSRALAGGMARDAPDRFAASAKPEARRGLILIDVARNSAGSTSVASYSPRALPAPTVAAPLAWAEVTGALNPAGLTVRTVPRRRDPWGDFEGARYPLPTMARQ